MACQRNHNSCTHNTAPSSGDLRLVQNGHTSSSYTSGRLEIYYSGEWGTVCNHYWSATNTRVACRQLGFAGAASSNSYHTSFAAGWDFTSITTLFCTAAQVTFANCTHGQSTLQVFQTGGGGRVLFRVFLHLVTKEWHVYCSSMPLKQWNFQQTQLLMAHNTQNAVSMV